MGGKSISLLQQLTLQGVHLQVEMFVPLLIKLRTELWCLLTLAAVLVIFILYLGALASVVIESQNIYFFNAITHFNGGYLTQHSQ